MSVLSEVLETLTNPQAADEAVAAAVQTFSDKASTYSASSIGDYLWDAFNEIFAVVGRTPPERQTRLVQFLGQLKDRTVVDTQGQPLSYEGGVVWRDLPSFGWIARDLWNFDALDASATPVEQSTWVNWTAFLAQLTGRGTCDYSLYALWSLRTAFEETHPDGANTVLAVKLAALWMLHAGEKLWEMSAKGITLDARLGVSTDKYADRGWRGFNEERWKVWKGGFKAALESTVVTDSTVQDALKVMEEQQ
ncbi:hypothetical protein MMYC01_210222 [Madurella mycetomatis]|uniref:Uncharacterized protein n=1 Tax=Madurella mycetomatis TaxID=100816 RepID=A0A175VNZ3_9PEZI|nr:hypothetical protein MMYC01_210222 [Madurella mycetomatis]